jgi:hypothetical protein
MMNPLWASEDAMFFTLMQQFDRFGPTREPTLGHFRTREDLERRLQLAAVTEYNNMYAHTNMLTPTKVHTHTLAETHTGALTDELEDDKELLHPYPSNIWTVYRLLCWCATNTDLFEPEHTRAQTRQLQLQQQHQQQTHTQSLTQHLRAHMLATSAPSTHAPHTTTAAFAGREHEYHYYYYTQTYLAREKRLRQMWFKHPTNKQQQQLHTNKQQLQQRPYTTFALTQTHTNTQSYARTHTLTQPVDNMPTRFVPSPVLRECNMDVCVPSIPASPAPQHRFDRYAHTQGNIHTNPQLHHTHAHTPAGTNRHTQQQAELSKSMNHAVARNLFADTHADLKRPLTAGSGVGGIALNNQAHTRPSTQTSAQTYAQTHTTQPPQANTQTTLEPADLPYDARANPYTDPQKPGNLYMYLRAKTANSAAKRDRDALAQHLITQDATKQSTNECRRMEHLQQKEQHTHAKQEHTDIQTQTRTLNAMLRGIESNTIKTLKASRCKFILDRARTQKMKQQMQHQQYLQACGFINNNSSNAHDMTDELLDDECEGPLGSLVDPDFDMNDSLQDSTIAFQQHTQSHSHSHTRSHVTNAQQPQTHTQTHTQSHTQTYTLTPMTSARLQTPLTSARPHTPSEAATAPDNNMNAGLLNITPLAAQSPLQPSARTRPMSARARASNYHNAHTNSNSNTHTVSKTTLSTTNAHNNSNTNNSSSNYNVIPELLTNSNNNNNNSNNVARQSSARPRSASNASSYMNTAANIIFSNTVAPPPDPQQPPHNLWSNTTDINASYNNFMSARRDSQLRRRSVATTSSLLSKATPTIEIPTVEPPKYVALDSNPTINTANTSNANSNAGSYRRSSREGSNKFDANHNTYNTSNNSNNAVGGVPSNVQVDRNASSNSSIFTLEGQHSTSIAMLSRLNSDASKEQNKHSNYASNSVATGAATGPSTSVQAQVPVGAGVGTGVGPAGTPQAMINKLLRRSSANSGTSASAANNNARPSPGVM